MADSLAIPCCRSSVTFGLHFLAGLQAGAAADHHHVASFRPDRTSTRSGGLQYRAAILRTSTRLLGVTTITCADSASIGAVPGPPSTLVALRQREIHLGVHAGNQHQRGIRHVHFGIHGARGGVDLVGEPRHDARESCDSAWALAPPPAARCAPWAPPIPAPAGSTAAGCFPRAGPPASPASATPCRPGSSSPCRRSAW